MSDYDELQFYTQGRLTVERVKYWMRVAGMIEESENPCYSRKIGVVIINPATDTLVSIGHNGPPYGNPSCDDKDYLQDVVWPQLTETERQHAFELMKKEMHPITEYCHENWFATYYAGCKVCPRRLIGADSGKRLEICSCAHAEHNAVVNAARDLSGFFMICHCGIPCTECSKTIVSSGIQTVVCLARARDYSPYTSRCILRNGGVNVIIKPEEYFGF